MSAQPKGMTWVGRAIRRLEDPALVAGRGRFTGDLPAAHWLRFVRSPLAAGKIVKIDAPKDAMVVTAADLAGVKPILPMLHKFNYRPVAQPILAETQVRFVGEPVAAVIAASEAEAEDIADAVALTIAETAAIVDGRAALAPGAPQVHAEVPGNVMVEGAFKTDGFDAAWAGAHKIITVEARSRRQNATPMEPRGGHAAYDAASGRVTLTCATQMPHLMRTAIAELVGMPESDLRVIAPDVGGGFGQKMSLAAEYVLLVWLARRPPKLVRLARGPAREPDRRLPCARPIPHGERRLRCRRPADRTQSRRRRQCRRLFLLPDHCGIEPLMAMAELPGPYDFRHYECRTRGVVTNTCPMGPYRGVSRPVNALGLERLMDKAAAAFGLDVVEIRRRNLVDRFPYTTAFGLELDEASYKQTLEMAAKAIDLPAFRARQSKRARKGAISASASPPSASAPVTAARPSPRAAWRSRPAGRP